MTYPADLYAALHRGNVGDTVYYRTACAGAEAVLELGCGVGRILSALGDDVGEVWGLDNHAGMLAVARADTEATLVLGGMQSFSLGRTFDRVLIPYNGLYCLVTDDDVVACLACVRRHLRPHGRLLLDVYPYASAPSPECVEEAQGDQPIVRIDTETQSYAVYESARFDVETDVATVTYRYVPDEGHAVTGVIVQRAITEARLRSFLEQAGFAIEKWEGGFQGQGLDEYAEQWVVTATVRPPVDR